MTNSIELPIWMYTLNILFIVIAAGVSLWRIYRFTTFYNDNINKMFNKQNTILDTLEHELNSSIKTLTNLLNYNSSLIKHEYNTTQEETSYKSLFDLFYKIKKITSNDLYENMVNIKACRLAIYLFHNGTKTPHGINFLKMSCIGDRTLIGSGVKEKIISHSSLAVNLFDKMINDLFDSGRSLIIRNDPNIEDSFSSEFLSAEKIQYSQAVCIYDHDNNILGFLLAEFDHLYNKSVSDEEYGVLKDYANKLIPIFSLTNYTALTMENTISKDGEKANE